MGFKAVLLSPTIVAGGTPPPATYPEAVAAIGTPPIWYKFQGASGTLAANSGSLGGNWDAAFNGTEYDLGNVGQIGANEAIENLDYLDEYIYAYGATPTQEFTSLTFARLIKVPVASLNTGQFNVLSNNQNRAYYQDNDAGTMKFAVATTNGTSDKTTVETFPRGAWFWTFGRWNGSTGVSSLVWGYGGALVSPGLAVDTSAATGSITVENTEFGLNRIGALIDEVILWDTVATDAQLLAIVTLSGLT